MAKKTKWGLRKKFWGGGVAGEGKEDKMRGMLRKKIEGGYAGEGKEDEIPGDGG